MFLESKLRYKMAYLEDSDRFQIRMGSLEEEIDKDNPVRFVDAFVELSLYNKLVCLQISDLNSF